MLKFVLTIFSILIVLFLHSSPKPLPPVIQKLLSIKGAVLINTLSNDQWIDIEDLPVSFKTTGQHLLKTNQSLFVTIPGTGRLYKAEINNNQYDFKRIDSTYFSGYNFNSLSFNFGDSIFNFGGEGFWHTNGNLRLFDQKINEWNAIELNKTIPNNFNYMLPATNFYFVNEKESKIVIEGPLRSYDYLKNPHADSTEKNKLFELNIKTGDWVELGKKNFQYMRVLGFVFGSVFSNRQLIDIKNNILYSHNLDYKLTSILGNSKKDNNFSISFCVDSTLYFGNAKNALDSITISRSNLSNTNSVAYFPIKKGSSLAKGNLLIIFCIGIAVLLLTVFLFRKNKFNSLPKKNLNETPNSDLILQNVNESFKNPVIYRSGKLVELLTEQEKSFLSFIYNHSKDERLTTIEEINKVLGTLNRSPELQKRIRGEMINGINEKLSIITKVNRPVIEKIRSEFDKRSFEYFIHKDHLKLAEDVMAT
jgi:hypothetical protein